MKPYLFLLFLFPFILFSCNETTNPGDNPDIKSDEIISQEISKNYEGNDLDFNFDNGAKISIKSNENPSAEKSTIKLLHITNENYFNTLNDIVFDFSNVNSKYTFNLDYNLPANLVKEDISLIHYSPADSKTKIAAKVIPFLYDNNTGKITAKFEASKSKPSGRVKDNESNSRLLLTWADRSKLSDGDEQVVMEVPYYEQPSGSCWATCAQMLAKAYPRNDDEYSKRLGVIDFVKKLGFSTLDDGIGLWDFKNNLPSAINLYSTTKTEVSTFVSKANMLQEILKKLQERKPMIMNLTYPGIGRHAIMIVGYRRELISIAKINLKLLIHNPQNLGDESMYKWVDWEWLMKDKWPQEAYQILYPKDPITSPNLVTMGLPINKQFGELNFIIGNDTKNYKVSLQYNKSKEDGYEWAFPNGDVCEQIPDTVSNLNLNIPIYNSGNQTKNVELILKVKNNKTNKVEIEESISYSAKPGNSKIAKDINITSIIGKEAFDGTLSFEMLSNGKYIDGYKLKFKIAPTISKIVTFGLSVKGTYNNQVIQIGTGCRDVKAKGSGTKYEGSFEINEKITSSMNYKLKGKVNIEFDKEINPTLIKKLVIERTMDNYYDDLHTSTMVEKVILNNIKIDNILLTLINGNIVCNYIESFSQKLTDHTNNGAGSYELNKANCDDESQLSVTIK